MRGVKESFGQTLMMPRVVILDPAITAHTPEWLFLSTGIRAVDHAVEDLCVDQRRAVFGRRVVARAPAARTRSAGGEARSADMVARLSADCQLGAWMSVVGSQNGVAKGASHGIGHVLGGTAGVAHGYTSCIMLPHVLRVQSRE